MFAQGEFVVDAAQLGPVAYAVPANTSGQTWLWCQVNDVACTISITRVTACMHASCAVILTESHSQGTPLLVCKARSGSSPLDTRCCSSPSKRKGRGSSDQLLTSSLHV